MVQRPDLEVSPFATDFAAALGFVLGRCAKRKEPGLRLALVGFSPRGLAL